MPVFAQLNLGRIYGAVVDQTGGAVASATVTVVDVARGVSRPLTADNAGQFNAPGLTPGIYTVRIEAKGFQTLERQNVEVGVGQEVRVDLTLQPGEQTQTVTVTDVMPMINTTSATLGGQLETQQLADLPLNGRSFVKTMDWVPGVASTNGNDYNFNGSFSNQNVWMFDGMDEFNPYGTGPIVGGTSGFTQATILPLDAINQVNIQTNPKAEYGWKVGGVVNTGIKSGTNDIHATAFAMGRDTAFDARNPFLTPQQGRSEDTFTQYGATIGGPIKKGKLFYFAAYEGQRYTVAIPAQSNRPVATSGLGTKFSIPDAIAAINGVNSALLSQLSVQMAGCNFNSPAIQALTGAAVAPACNATTAGAGALPGAGNSGIFFNSTNSSSVPIAVPLTGGSDNGVAKLDYHVNDHSSINGEYFYGLGNSNQENGPSTTAQPYWLTAKHTVSQLGRAVWIYTPSSNWVNEMRFGVDREYQTGAPAECTQNLGQPNYLTDYGFQVVNAPSPYCGFPQLSVSGFTALGTTETSGGPSDVHWDTFSGIDAVSYTHDKHLMKFGFEVHDTLLNGTTKLNFIHGKLAFGSARVFTGATALEDFLTGFVGSSQVLVGNNAVPGYSNITYPRYALFGQDDWRVSPKLTLNLGLRWEVTPAPSAPAGQLATFNPSQGMLQLGQQISSLYPTDWTEFQPRFGLAYDVTGKGTTVIRAGVSIMNIWEPINSFLSPRQAAALNIIPTGWKLYNGTTLLASPGTIVTGNLSPPSSALNWVPNAQIFPSSSQLLACGNGLAQVTIGATTFTPSPCSIQPVSTNLKPGFVTTWTAGIQHAITNNISLSVAYVGTRGLNIPFNDNINMPAPGEANGGGHLLAEQVRRPYFNQFPYLGDIYLFTSGGVTRYNALQVAVNTRSYHGISSSANYTYGKSTGNVDQDYGSYVMRNDNPSLDVGPSSFDYRHTFNMTFTYAIPSIKVPGQLLQGWSVNTVLSVLSAGPYDVQDSTDVTGTGGGRDRWTLVGNPSNLQSGVGQTNIPFYAFGPNMPQACLAAAAAEPNGLTDSTLPLGAALPAAEGGGVNSPTTGLQQLQSEGCYYRNGTALVPPAQGTFGSMPRDGLRTGTPFREWDASLTKLWTIKERFNAQFRWEIYNITNSPVYALPNIDPSVNSGSGALGVANSLNNSGDPVLGTGGPRQMDLQLKLSF